MSARRESHFAALLLTAKKPIDSFQAAMLREMMAALLGYLNWKGSAMVHWNDVV
jgi:hypothetical protein